jgi:hypothetical protein
VFALAGLVSGLSSAIMWMPQQNRMEPLRFVEEFQPPDIPVAPGRRVALYDVNGHPADFVDVHLTELLPNVSRLYRAVRTNKRGHAALTVPAGVYRIQALDGFSTKIDRIIVVPAEEHPDIELHLERVQMFHFIADR